MPLAQTRTETDAVQASVLRTLAYFDIFRHPVTVDELARFSDRTLERERLLATLDALRTEGLVQRHEGHWSLRDASKAVLGRREDEERARQRMPRAEAMARRIAAFPFVRAVFVSGSLSKGRLADDGDIDFFIITAPGRLWLARTLLVLYKKVFLLNSRRDFCVNYFLDTEHLAVEDRNRFTAMEVATLLPMYGNGTTEAFFARNAWAFEQLPGADPRPSLEVAEGDTPRKRRWERRLSGALGETLDGWCMRLTWRYWQIKFPHMDRGSFEVALRTRSYVSKHHPRNFQQRVLDALRGRLCELERRVGLPLQ
ncbi:MAG: nucleotidyltransferase domain-containing protein [Flavobacteriales bacterium]|nr:nucleotidyltransferase domain-containing protein [Flavobacteriales bacterium]